MTRRPTFAFRLSPFAFRPRRQRGQALLIAVLVLFAVGTLAALFTAIIASQLVQVTRQSDVVALRNIAEAGLRLANEELTYSPLGADWRPSNTAYLCGNGQVTVEVSYGPSPDQLQSRFLRVLSTAVFPDNPFLRHTILALKPVLLTDYARLITDRFETNQPAALGVAGIEAGGRARTDYISAIEGPIRSNTDLVWYGRSLLGLRTTFDQETNWRDLGILRDDRVEVAGRMLPGPFAGVDDVLEFWIDGVLRAQSLFAPANPTEQADYGAGFAKLLNDQRVPNTTTVLANLPDYTMVTGEVLSPQYEVPRIRPPEVDAVRPDTGTNRYWMLTRDSGEWKRASANEPLYNTGETGWGWASYGGIYIDNGPYVDQDGNAHAGDVQYNHDLEKLRLNWVRSVGAHQTAGDLRAATTGKPPVGPADWWDKTGRYYAPPGVEIILHGEAECPYIEIVRHDVRRDPATETYYFWRDPDGAPIGALASPVEPDQTGELTWQYAPVANQCVPSSASQTFGVYDGNRAIVPFPPNGVIYAEGNVRIRGIMPPVRDNRARVGAEIGADDVPLGYFGEWSSTGGRSRRFDLQVVSDGTIYIEGDLLSPSAAYLGGLVPFGQVDNATYYRNEALYSSRLALLARDYVCLNTTALNPRPVDALRPREVAAQDGTKSYQHYNDLQPTYLSSGNEGYLLFEGDTDETLNSAVGASTWDPAGGPIRTIPEFVRFRYTNPRLQVPNLASQLADLRLILGHSGLYVQGATPTSPGLGNTPSLPTEGDGTTSDQPSVEVTMYVNDLAHGTPYPWGNGGSAYTFVRPTANYAEDQSHHWYLDSDITQIAWENPEAEDWLESLPNQYQAMLLQSGTGGSLLAGVNDIIDVMPHVSPVRHYDADTGQYTWIVPPKDLGYLLGPVAIAPPRSADPLQVEIDALIYAQNGSWFVLPGRWFNDNPAELGADPLQQEYPGYHEPLNIRISVHGAIGENMPADLGSVADWTSKWCGPVGQEAQHFLSYSYDPLLRYPRRETRDRIGYLRFPNFPLTSDLVVWGERVTGPAGS
ncbi:MAG: hypothetical protein ACE149_12115 [Armatimonadota bacterium]